MILIGNKKIFHKEEDAVPPQNESLLITPEGNSMIPENISSEEINSRDQTMESPNNPENKDVIVKTVSGNPEAGKEASD